MEIRRPPPLAAYRPNGAHNISSHSLPTPVSCFPLPGIKICWALSRTHAGSYPALLFPRCLLYTSNLEAHAACCKRTDGHLPCGQPCGAGAVHAAGDVPAHGFGSHQRALCQRAYGAPAAPHGRHPVSYTHLDVYKRQSRARQEGSRNAIRCPITCGSASHM